MLSRTFSILLFSSLFLISEIAFAQSAGAGAPGKAPGMGDVFFRMIPMFIIVFAIFFFLVIRPQERKLKAHNQLLDALKKGDQVVTSSGIIARVAGIEKDYILLEVSGNTKIKVERSHISKRYQREDSSSKAA